ncbi:HWE histidine kinase domain-containing protein [Pseudoruegeria sp. HB172150]|uniref:HWE histidine kinase domain-containing protein n=1 Tax=Pseudoruegeria sp. HB172150 TaxID=2721164 RepID=UPI001555882E|nr:HWE histidine kinase domain-containing protein [Pseudoruegeria sp. HB172150]
MIYNDAFVPILGNKHPCLGKPFLEVWAETAETIRPIAARALAGESTFVEDFVIETNRSGKLEPAYFTFCYSPIRDEHGVVRGMLDTVMETTGKVKAERMADLRNRELIHRSRNAYALISIVVNQSFRSGGSVEDIKAALQARINALVEAQDILMETDFANGSLDIVAQRSLQPFLEGVGRIELRGDPLEIGREQVTTLSLALHELATNSVKYGALSTHTGKVVVEWGLNESPGEQPHFRLSWTETGGPEVKEPTQQGFGSRIITQSLPASFGGTLTLLYAPEGLSMVLEADAPFLLQHELRAAE